MSTVADAPPVIPGMPSRRREGAVRRTTAAVPVGVTVDGHSGRGRSGDRPRATEGPGTSDAPVVIGGRRLRPTAVFDTYWRFAVARQLLYFDRFRGMPAAQPVDARPDGQDPILSAYRFTNCYRACDRVSQFAIAPVSYPDGTRWPAGWDERDVVFRVLLFKIFNKIGTWRALEKRLGTITWRDWQTEAARAVLDAMWGRGERLYSAAYVIPPPRLGGTRKHADHLLLLETLMADGLTAQVTAARSLREVFTALRSRRSLGDFLAYQFAIDLNYSPVLDFSENSFVAAGPGARDGIRKCFGPDSRGIESQIITWVTDTQQEHFARLGLSFPGLGGRRLHLIDCQNLFCEVDKYSRVAHPEIGGLSGRTRIKQHYRPDPAPLPTPWFPPKWGINDAVAAQLGELARD
ncbi:nucleotide kinase domain-containing protein [Saccharothrix hoggarensis]|uniref:Nucleotide kinase domain-containing protein n=1 Tax=Saccharothrix hoggarensis TaxID=913853 RepID=A0ABW3QN01_9PSEU